jgi:hypothetical protein
MERYIAHALTLESGETLRITGNILQAGCDVV